VSGGEPGSSVTVHHEADASKVDENRWKAIVIEEAASILMQDLDQLDPKTPDQATLLNLEVQVQAALRRIGGRVVGIAVQDPWPTVTPCRSKQDRPSRPAWWHQALRDGRADAGRTPGPTAYPPDGVSPLAASTGARRGRSGSAVSWKNHWKSTAFRP
jgi:hypothetical protein